MASEKVYFLNFRKLKTNKPNIPVFSYHVSINVILLKIFGSD